MRFLLLMMIVIALGTILAGLVPGSGPRRRAAAGGTDAACGMCGYSVRGLDKLTCPECGSDLRRVGIVAASSAAREPLAFIGAAFFFSVAMFFAGWIVTSAVLELLP